MAEGCDIAYFSMEIALHVEMPTYGGGLGVLAGDTLRAAADLGIRMVGVTLLHRDGYFHQRLTPQGRQTEESVRWAVNDFATELPARAVVRLEGRDVQVRPWQFDVRGHDGGLVRVYLLDTDLPENAAEDRALTGQLYGGDHRHRFRQEALLGIGGLRTLRALGYTDLRRYHMNEGHSSLLVVELLRERLEERDTASAAVSSSRDVLDEIRTSCVFTTHTPIAVAHDRYPAELVRSVLGEACTERVRQLLDCTYELNMTELGLRASHYVNGVAKSHGEISRRLFPSYSIDAITNGVHAATWTSPAMSALFDRFIPGWQQDNFALRSALSLSTEEVQLAHRQAKRELLRFANHQVNAGFDIDYFTIGFGRRMTAYKRPMLLFSDIARLERMARDHGPVQILYAGKAHPDDQPGKDLIAEIVDAGRRLQSPVSFAYLPNYDFEVARLLVSGVDVWLNTPQPPLEASGTSGMKAALNGVPSLSVLDGWWLEGCIEGVTGWSIGAAGSDPNDHANALQGKLETVVLPLYYRDPQRFTDVMRHAIALNGAFFNAQRMLQQYLVKAYYR